MGDADLVMPQPVPRRELARTGLGLAGIIFVLDQATKYWVLDRLGFSPEGCLDYQRASDADRLSLTNTCGHIEISPVFDLTMVWNKGVSFGLFGADGVVGRSILVVFSVVVAAVLAAGLLGRGPLKAIRRLQAIGFGLIIGGALGNAIDRVIYGAVADFLNFSDIGFPWVFNVADVGINLGVMAILADVFLHDTGPRRRK
ncbi:signal peptidase II [Maricaulis sp. CAU 1757]